MLNLKRSTITTITLQPRVVAQVQRNIVEIGVGAVVATELCSFKKKIMNVGYEFQGAIWVIVHVGVSIY